MMNQFYKAELEAITPQEPVVLLRTFDKPELKAGLGALTSTKAEAPSMVLDGWGDEAKVSSTVLWAMDIPVLQSSVVLHLA